MEPDGVRRCAPARLAEEVNDAAAEPVEHCRGLAARDPLLPLAS
jgi:hypothetical protein